MQRLCKLYSLKTHKYSNLSKLTGKKYISVFKVLIVFLCCNCVIIDFIDQMILIKKYSNRRLYNTESSSYITQEDVVTLIKNKKDFKIQDADNKQDLTSSVLIQILVDRENSGTNLMPQEFLKEIILHYENDRASEMYSFLNNVLNFANANSLFSKGFDNLMKFNPFDFQKYINSLNNQSSENLNNKKMTNNLVDKNLKAVPKNLKENIKTREKTN